MYWKAIGTSVRAVYEHTYLFNRLWGHPVYPLGQTYGGAGRKSIQRFRRFAASYESLAPSWWDWQETTTAGWQGLGAEITEPILGYRPITSQPLLKSGSKGDLVVWAQEHLRSAGEQVPVTGIYGKLTRAAVRDFQTKAGLNVDGVIGTATWQSLLRYEPTRYLWAGRRVQRDRGRRDPQPRDRPQPPALGLAARQGLRDRSRSQALIPKIGARAGPGPPSGA